METLSKKHPRLYIAALFLFVLASEPIVDFVLQSIFLE